VVGWVANAPTGAVIGRAEGGDAAVSAFRHWLRRVGSPKSTIVDAHFTCETALERLGFAAFEVRR
jgi:acylphosphatase